MANPNQPRNPVRKSSTMTSSTTQTPDTPPTVIIVFRHWAGLGRGRGWAALGSVRLR